MTPAAVAPPSTGEPRDGHRTALGAAIRGLRQGRGQTLRDLADLVGVSPATLSGIETGKTGVSSERLTRVAEALGVPVERLLSSSSSAQDEPPPTLRSPGPAGSAGPQVPDDWRDYPPLQLDAALTGALSAFLELGYHGASMRVIAERAGLSVPGLYHHYASKQEMLVALLDLTMQDLRVRMVAAREQGRDVVERFALVVECLALFHTHRRELGFVGASEMRSLEPAERARVAALRIDEQRVVDEAVEAGVGAEAFSSPQPHDVARAVVTMCTALPQWFRPDGPASAEQVAQQYVAFALDLVRCDPARRPVVGDRGGATSAPVT
ncbi:MAG: TetR family transcriptional regulator [Actinomycetota bacterium]|nr:TetR family transcriptional regulator [Actinomycetota bacterium]